MVLFERALVSSYRPSIVTFPLSLHVSEMSLLCSSTPLPQPTSSLPKFSHVSLGVGGWPLGYEERRCWAMELVSKISNVCDPGPPTLYRRTDGQTDHSASRGKKVVHKAFRPIKCRLSFSQLTHVRQICCHFRPHLNLRSLLIRSLEPSFYTSSFEHPR